MANNRAIRIAGPILAKSYKAETGAPLRTVAAIRHDIVIALTAAGLPACVVEDWGNEPSRRAGMAKMAGERVAAHGRRAASDKRRRDAKSVKKKILHRIATRVQKKIGRAFSVARAAFRAKSSRNQ